MVNNFFLLFCLSQAPVLFFYCTKMHTTSMCQQKSPGCPKNPDFLLSRWEMYGEVTAFSSEKTGL